MLTPTVAVLFSSGLDSAVLLAHAARDAAAVPVYVGVGLAWESDEIAVANRLLASPPYRNAAPLVTLHFDMRDVYPATHWAIRGRAPAFDTDDRDVYLEGRNIVLLAKTAVLCARLKVSRIALGPLANNPFPDASPEFFATMGRALSLGLARSIEIDTPLTTRHKEDVIRLGVELGVPLELSMSCMNPRGDAHCGACSKCRERRDAFEAAGVRDPTTYVVDWKTTKR